MKYKQSKKPLVSIRLEPKLSDFGLSIIVECIYIECIITLLDKSLIKLFTVYLNMAWQIKLIKLSLTIFTFKVSCLSWNLSIYKYERLWKHEKLMATIFKWTTILHYTYILLFFWNNFANTNCSVIFTSYTFQRLLYNKRWQGFIYLLSAFLGSVLGRPLLLY